MFKQYNEAYKHPLTGACYTMYIPYYYNTAMHTH